MLPRVGQFYSETVATAACCLSAWLRFSSGSSSGSQRLFSISSRDPAAARMADAIARVGTLGGIVDIGVDGD